MENISFINQHESTMRLLSGRRKRFKSITDAGGNSQQGESEIQGSESSDSGEDYARPKFFQRELRRDVTSELFELLEQALYMPSKKQALLKLFKSKLFATHQLNDVVGILANKNMSAADEILQSIIDHAPVKTKSLFLNTIKTVRGKHFTADLENAKGKTALPEALSPFRLTMKPR